MNAPHTTDVEFSQLGLDDRLLKSLDEHSLTHCTAIQAECLPIALAGKDVAGQAQTGTGKTAAFLLTIMQHLLDKPERPGRKQQQPRAIIISPTRELAIQIHKDAVMLNAHAGLSLGLVYGGVDYEKQRNSLNEKIDILIGTPGRLIDYHKQNVYSLKGIEIVVLDEADRMFDLGFIADIRYMFRRMPPPENRQNMLFSATLSHRVTELAYEHMNSPEKIIINPDQVTAENVKQTMYHVANDEKIPLLLGLMKRIDPKRSIVFVNTKRAAERVWSYLEGNGFHSAVLSGDVPQNKRQRLFKEFSEGKLPVLVATDLAARGLHVPEISHVFNYDLPQNAEDYVHRIGRTARAGASGDAVSFACEEFVYSLMEIEEYIGHKLPASEIVAGMLAEPKPPVKIERKRSGGGGKGRNNGGGRNRSNRSSSRRR
ncbi:MAG: RNA helicase [Gammaproteobacteria bacterium]|nr:MAG: RNA helicase [Gammaproteobacteria bacterium]RKZ70671.1 MAG: RNA helicase [Gammaproteobacteria bacterium]